MKCQKCGKNIKKPEKPAYLNSKRLCQACWVEEREISTCPAYWRKYIKRVGVFR